MSATPEIVVIGTSSGGLAALKQLAANLPENFPAAILVVMHVGKHDSILPDILLPYSALPVRHANHREPIKPGTILIAPPDHHLLVEPGRTRLFHGPKENFARPAIDPLFRSAAIAYRAKTIGVILTGHLDDGTVGLQAVKAYGGIAIVQDPEEAEAPSMPRSAIRHVDVDFCLRLEGIADTLARLAGQQVKQPHDRTIPEWVHAESDFISGKESNMEELEKIAQLSPLTCPECSGTLWEMNDTTLHRFRCHTGHGFTARALKSAQDQVAEEAIWAAVRALHEKQALLKQFEKRARADQQPEMAAEHAAAAERARHQAETLRKMTSGS